MADGTQGITGIYDMVEKLHAGATGSAAQGLDIGSLLGSMSMTSIVVSVVAGLIGSGYFMYGKRSQNLKMVFTGIALCVVPYFIGNSILLIVACLALTAAPFLL
jgi:hypothetical protein